MAILELLVLASSLLPSRSPVGALAAGAPRPLLWKNVRGADGPWHTLRVAYGSPPQELDVYPGPALDSVIQEASMCFALNVGERCIAQDAGLYDYKASTTFRDLTTMGGSETDGIFFGTRGDYFHALDTLVLPAVGPSPEHTIRSHHARVATRGTQEYPKGGVQSTVGALSLGGPFPVQQYENKTAQPSVILEGVQTIYDLVRSSVVPSNSYGLHIGSPSLNIPPSLYFGGYDRSRAIGPVSATKYGLLGAFRIELVDLGLGVEVGGSPFRGFSSKAGLLLDEDGFPPDRGSLTASIEAPRPGIYLPHRTCQALASNLPVAFDKTLGTYLWDVDSPDYARIVDSPAYLGFTFRANGSTTQNTEIRVPFKLLNLTLTAPYTATPTPYFPCYPPSAEGQGSFALGRAFLQAAFLGVNWVTTENSPAGTFFLAQAPGPVPPTPRDVVAISPNDRTVTPSTRSLASTWQGVWTELPPDAGSGANPPPGDGGGGTGSQTGDGSGNPASTSPPTAMVIGLAVMGAALGALSLGLLTWCLLRRRKLTRAREAESSTTFVSTESEAGVNHNKITTSYINEADGNYSPVKRWHELGQDVARPAEMSSVDEHRHRGWPAVQTPSPGGEDQPAGAMGPPPLVAASFGAASPVQGFSPLDQSFVLREQPQPHYRPFRPGTATDAISPVNAPPRTLPSSPAKSANPFASAFDSPSPL